MGRHNLEYPTGARNTVNRLGKKRGKSSTDYSQKSLLYGLTTNKSSGTYELGKIHAIVQQTPVLHVSFSPGADDPFPVILPMIGVMGSFDSPSAELDEPLDCYLHGYISSRIMNLTRRSEDSVGLPVCIAATKVDGLVLSLTPNSHSYNYRSVVLFGHAHLVEDVEEKLWAMEKVTDKVVPGRWAGTRTPPNKGEMASTQILKVVIESGSGKIRDGPPGDEKCDLDDEAVMNSVWTGVVPMIERLETPVASAYNKVKDVPEHVKNYVEEFNKTAEEYRDKINASVSGDMKRYGEI